MGNGVVTSEPFVQKEAERQDRYEHVWTKELNDVFADVAPYYDAGNLVASLGLWGVFRKSFLSTIDLAPGMEVLDVCAGTNAVGIAMCEKEPKIHVTAFDRSKDMQRVGRERAQARGFTIDSVIGDSHHLPFPDNSFDVVTLQFATRHLRVMRVFGEIQRVLKPGGTFYHSDMLRPSNSFVAWVHYNYLKLCLNFTALIFRSNEAALNCREYFVDVLSRFYSAPELTELLSSMGFENPRAKTLMGGLLGYHKAVKPK